MERKGSRPGEGGETIPVGNRKNAGRAHKMEKMEKIGKKATKAG